MAYRKTEFVERKRRETRARILNAATGLVRAGGWRDCTLKAVAERAGVATGSLYTHFEKVTDLYAEVFREIAETELAVIAALGDAGAPAEKRLDEAILVFTGRAIRGRVQAYAVIGEPLAPEVEAVRQNYRRRFAEPFERIIREGIATGVFSAPDPAVAATCVLGVLSEAMIAPLAPNVDASQDDERRLRDAVLDFCRRAVGAPGVAERQE